MDNIVIIGAGESGTGAALLAHRKKMNVFVSDSGIIKDEFRQELNKHNIPFEEGGHNFERILEADVIVKSPGIPGSSEVIQYFRLRHKEIISEIEFASRFYNGGVIGITGSNGKTTTTKLCQYILANANIRSAEGGNVGYSFSRLLLEDRDLDWVVLELSSFQLEDILSFRSDISVILNITPDHLDRYDYDFMKYARAKWNLALATKKEGVLVLNESNEVLHTLSQKIPAKCELQWLKPKVLDTLVSKETGKQFDMKIRGWHNAYNASVSVLIARRLGVSESKIAEALSSFQPVEHRMEVVAQHGALEFINDSKSTNIDSCFVALDSLDRPVVWIAGGTDKGNDYSQLDSLVREKVVGLICLTRDDAKLRKSFSFLGDRIASTEDVDEAIHLAASMSHEGTVLLSPACASFDLFKNYEDRGRKFKNAVLKYLNGIDQ